MHLTLAGVITLLIAGVAVPTYRLPTVRPDLHMLGIVTAVNLVLQSMVAAIAVFSRLQLLATLSHTMLMSALFVVLSKGAAASGRADRASRSPPGDRSRTTPRAAVDRSTKAWPASSQIPTTCGSFTGGWLHEPGPVSIEED